MSIDLELDTNQDLILTNGDLVLISEGEEVAQSFKIRMLHILGEWVFDYTLGVDWLGTMFSTETNKFQKDAVVREALLETQHVRRILQAEFFVDPIERSAQVEFTADTDYGVVSSELTI